MADAPSPRSERRAARDRDGSACSAPTARHRFNGRVPQKPAWGLCPVCRRNGSSAHGDISSGRPASILQRQSDSASGTDPRRNPFPAGGRIPPERKSNTGCGDEVRAAPPPPDRPVPPRPKAEAENELNEEARPSGGWDGRSGSKGPPVKAPPETDTGLDAVAKEMLRDSTISRAAPPPSPRARSPIARNADAVPGRTPAAGPPPSDRTGGRLDAEPSPPPPTPPASGRWNARAAESMRRSRGFRIPSGGAGSEGPDQGRSSSA